MMLCRPLVCLHISKIIKSTRFLQVLTKSQQRSLINPPFWCQQDNVQVCSGDFISLTAIFRHLHNGRSKHMRIDHKVTKHPGLNYQELSCVSNISAYGFGR